MVKFKRKATAAVYQRWLRRQGGDAMTRRRANNELLMYVAKTLEESAHVMKAGIKKLETHARRARVA